VICRRGREQAARRVGRAGEKTSTAVFTKSLGAGIREHDRGIAFFYDNDFLLRPHGELDRVEPAFVNAQLVEHRGRLEIVRRNSFEVESKSMVDSPLGVAPITVSLTMPSPFAGTAEYLEHPGSPPSWSGNLSVSLPGAPSVPLSGPGFKSIFCRGPIDSKKTDRCTAEANSLFFSSLKPFTLAFTASARARSAARRLSAE
jgi:hypothetical protein